MALTLTNSTQALTSGKRFAVSASRRVCSVKCELKGETKVDNEEIRVKETQFLSVSAAPVLTLAAAEGLREALEPVGELVRSWNLPDWLIHWGHPGNMAVVLIAMGGYGSYLGWQIRLSNGDILEKAKDLHPKLMGGMFFFFALGATGGITSLITSGRPILDSTHAVTGLTGLGLLTLQSVLSANFKGKPELRSIHAYLGTSIMALFVVHAILGLQLGLSF